MGDDLLIDSVDLLVNCLDWRTVAGDLSLILWCYCTKKSCPICTVYTDPSSLSLSLSLSLSPSISLSLSRSLHLSISLTLFPVSLYMYIITQYRFSWCKIHRHHKQFHFVYMLALHRIEFCKPLQNNRQAAKLEHTKQIQDKHIMNTKCFSSTRRAPWANANKLYACMYFVCSSLAMCQWYLFCIYISFAEMFSVSWGIQTKLVCWGRNW